MFLILKKQLKDKGLASSRIRVFPCVFILLHIWRWFTGSIMLAVTSCVYLYTTDCAPVFQGFYMYIETSRPRKEGDQARLISPFFNVAPKNPYGITNPPAYCFGFFYHMYGKHIGKLHSLYAPSPTACIKYFCAAHWRNQWKGSA